MQAEVKNGNLIITLPLQAPQPSSTGKTLIVASSHRAQATSALVEGRPVKVSVNAMIGR